MRDLIGTGGPGQPPMDHAGPWRTLVRRDQRLAGTAVVSMEFLGPRTVAQIERVVASFPDTSVGGGAELPRPGPADPRDVARVGAERLDDGLAGLPRRGAHRGPVGGRPGKNFWRHQAIPAMARRWAGAVEPHSLTLLTVPRPGAAPDLLWQRFASILDIDPAGCDLDVRANPSIGLATAQMLLRLNRRMQKEDGSLPASYDKYVKHILAKRGLVDRQRVEPKLGLDRAWVDKRGRQQVKRLRADGHRVVGDLDELLPAPVDGHPCRRGDPRTGAGCRRRRPGSHGRRVEHQDRRKRRRERRRAAPRRRRLVRLSRRRPPTDAGPPPGSWSRESCPSLGVITMARDEGPMLRRWVEHYAAQVGAEHVLVVDDNSSDGSTDDLPCPVLRIPHLRKRGFEPSRMGLLAGLSAGLLEAYDAILFCRRRRVRGRRSGRATSPCAHFVAARAGPRGGRASSGLNVIHDTPREPALDLDRPLLDQRTLAKFMPLMCKPALKWEAGRLGARLARDPVPVRGRPRAVHVPLEVRRPRATRGGRRAAPPRQHHREPGCRHQLGAARRRDGGAARRGGRRRSSPAGPTSSTLPPRIWRASCKKQGHDVARHRQGPGAGMRSRPVVRIPERFRGLL